MNASWQQVANVRELKAKGSLLVRVSGKQIALFDTPKGVRACNNRCPHEGYPLKEGSLDGSCVLTCNWHNWKFDLDSGANLYGGDRLRVYPVEVRDEDIWVDIQELPVEVRQAEVHRNLCDAFADNAYDRIAREIGRLGLLGTHVNEAVRLGVQWSFEHMEFGWTHAFAAAADWLAVRDAMAGDEDAELVCAVEAMAHMADDVLREPKYPYPVDEKPYDEEAFVAAVECEDEVQGIALIRGAMSAGLGFAGVERGLTRAALAHYQGFGHALIYVPKAGALIERLGEDMAEPLLVCLVRRFVYSQRDDLIPEFRGYQQALGRWGQSDNPGELDWRRLRETGIARSFEAVSASGDQPTENIYEALLAANAAHLVGFDLDQQARLDGSISDNVTWLDVTHGITFANAVRTQCMKFPELWPSGLLQMACFSGRNKGFTLDGAGFEKMLDRWRVTDPARFFEQS
ncbi:MAG: Rieske (2Fe-2S) protein, partial [Gammaproteobacteria bacterium]